MPLYYDRYWSSRPGGGDFDKKWPTIMKYLPKDGGVILEYGCGKGKLIEAMSRVNPDARYIGIDVSSVALDFAREKFPSCSFYLVRDGDPFPLRDGSVDFIMASEVIEHVYDTEHAFRELSRVLKPSGKLLLTTPYHGLAKNVLISLFRFEKHYDPRGAHIRFFTKGTLLKSISRAGLHVNTCAYYGRIFPIPHCIVVLAEKN